MTQELVPRAVQHPVALPSQAELATMLAMAEQLAASGMMPPHLKNGAAVLAVIQFGREIGVPPMQAVNKIAFINGKPAAQAELLLALIFRDHGPEAFRWTETGPLEATCEYKRRGGQPTRYTYCWRDAEQAGLTNNMPWKKYPSAMLRARCISAVARMAFPDCIGGLYTPEELGAEVTVNREGEVEIAPEAIVQAGNVPPEAVQIAPRTPADASGSISGGTPDPEAMNLNDPTFTAPVIREIMETVEQMGDDLAADGSVKVTVTGRLMKMQAKLDAMDSAAPDYLTALCRIRDKAQAALEKQTAGATKS